MWSITWHDLELINDDDDAELLFSPNYNNQKSFQQQYALYHGICLGGKRDHFTYIKGQMQMQKTFSKYRLILHLAFIVWTSLRCLSLDGLLFKVKNRIYVYLTPIHLDQMEVES